MDIDLPRAADVRAAAARIAPYAHRTPVLTSRTMDELAGARVHFKCENLQRVGAFKFRGACNTVFSLSDDEAGRGVVTHSSGNHAAAVALAARLRGVKATVVMPSNANAIKRRAVEAYGAKVIECEPTQADREAQTDRVIAAQGAVLVHPYDDPRVIAGQGTAITELVADAPGIEAVVTPVGGGGLLAGATIALADHAPAIRIFGAEPAGADDAFQSLRSGRRIPVESPDTIADGLRTSLGEINFRIIETGVTDIVRIEEAEIIAAMRLAWERLKMVIEPSSAVAVAALLQESSPLRGLRVGVVLTGGNVDLDELPW